MDIYIVESYWEDFDNDEISSSLIYKKGFLSLDKAKEFAEVQIKKDYKEFNGGEEAKLFDEKFNIQWQERVPSVPGVEVEGVVNYEKDYDQKYWACGTITDDLGNTYYIHLIRTD